MFLRRYFLLLALMLAGCATPISLDAPSSSISDLGARRILQGLPAQGAYLQIGTRGHDSPITRVEVRHDSWLINNQSFRFQDITGLMRSSDHMLFISYGPRQEGMWISVIDDPRALADALVRLRHSAAVPEPDFRAIAESYRTSNPRPAPTEILRRYQIRAETAVRAGQFPKAAEIYAQALDEAPWWPQGHFNLALVLETIGDYSAAIEEMQRYLMLVPDASNARAAQDKIYEWELKTERDSP